MDFKYCKLEIFLPPSHLEVLQKALQEVDAGHIGNYDSCMSVSPVTGYWRPLDGCNPYIGTNGEISCEPELKVEVTVYTENVDKIDFHSISSFSFFPLYQPKTAPQQDSGRCHESASLPSRRRKTELYRM